MAGMISINTHLKFILGLRGVFDIDFFLCRSDMMCIMGQYIPLSQYLDKHLQYLQPVLTFWDCALIFDAIIPKIPSFGGFYFVIFVFPLFLPKMHVFPVGCEVMSPRSVNYC